MNKKVIVSICKCSKVIQHHVELSINDVEKLYQLLAMGLELTSFTHKKELDKSWSKVRKFMSSLETEEHDKIIEKYFITQEMSFEEVMDKFNITDYKVYSDEEFFSKFGHEDARPYLKRYPANSVIQYRYNELTDDWEVAI